MPSIAVLPEHKRKVLDLYYEWELSQNPEGSVVTVVMPSEGPPMPDGRATLHSVPAEVVALAERANVEVEIISTT